MTLSTDLAARTDDELRILLEARPGLLTRPPASFAELAGRLASDPHADSIVAGLDAWRRQVLEAVLFLDGGTAADATALLARGHDSGPPPEAVAAALDGLRALGLLWRDPDPHGRAGRYHAVDAVRRLFPHPFGFGPSAAVALGSRSRDELVVALRAIGGLEPGEKAGRKDALVAAIVERLQRPGTVQALLDGAPAAAVELFESALHRGVQLPYSYNMGWGRRRNDVDWLLERALVVRTSYDRAEVPREVAFAVRGRVVDTLAVTRPPLTDGGRPVDPAARDAAALVAGTAIVAAVEALGLAWGEQPPTLLKSGGVGARDLKRLAKLLDSSETDAAFVVELAGAAGLVAVDRDEVVPTPRFDEWRALPLAARWTALVDAWRASDRVLGLAGRRDDDGKLVPALVFGTPWPGATWQRRAVLGALAELPPSTAPDRRAFAASVVWLAPGGWRGPAEPGELVAWLLDEAERLGVTGHGAFVDRDRAELAAHASGDVTLQADLTAIAHGPLQPDLSALLDASADVVSTGAATVWRFSEASVRRALDHGRTADDILARLEAAAVKGVPQPLAYLVADVARRHGTVRAGKVSSYLRSDDPAVLAAAVRVKGAAKLGLRILAPTVAVATAPVAKVLEALREAGLAPVEEDSAGGVVLRSDSARRVTPSSLDARMAGMWSRREPPAPPPRRDPAEVIGGLRAGPVPGSSASPAHPDHRHDALERYDTVDLDTIAGYLAAIALLEEAAGTGDAVVVEWEASRDHTEAAVVRVVAVNETEIIAVGANGGTPFVLPLERLLDAIRFPEARQR